MTSNDAVLTPVLIVVGLFLAIPFLMMTVMMPMAAVGGWGHMTTGSGGWGLLPLVVVPVLLAGAIYLLSTGRNKGSQQADTAIDELRTAYARGELSDEEFDTRRELLKNEH
jgi:putative membrane protein